MINITIAEDNLTIPNAFGSSNVQLNGNHIPSAKIWGVLQQAMAHEEKVDKEYLLSVAKESETFRWVMTTMLVYTFEPKKDDRHVAGFVYQRHERQRVRPLSDKFDIVIAKTDYELNPETVKALHEAASSLGLYPVGMNDGRVYYSPDPDSVFDAFGTSDWVRVAVMLKRPGGSSRHIELK
jgi:hypothetical protein